MLRPVRAAYATTKQELDTAFATADQITVEGDDALLTYAIRRAALEGLMQPLESPGAARLAFQSHRGVGVRTLVAILIFSGVVIGYSTSALWDLVRAPSSTLPPTTVLPAPGAPPPPSSSDAVTSIISSAGWPLVALAAIVALFLIARQAISSGSNVTIVWKVTEKVSGRVVISKVKERASRQNAAA